MRAETCGDEGDLLHPLRVEDANAVATLIRDKEHRTVGGQAHVDRQAADVRVADDHPSREIDFHDGAAELGAGHEYVSVRGKVQVVGTGPGDRDTEQQSPAGPVVDIKPVEPFGHHHRGRAVWCEVEVIWIGDPDGLDGQARARIDHGQRIGAGVVHIEPFQIPRGRDVVGHEADGEVCDHQPVDRIDHIHRAVLAIRDVDPRRDARYLTPQVRLSGCRVEVRDPGDAAHGDGGGRWSCPDRGVRNGKARRSGQQHGQHGGAHDDPQTHPGPTRHYRSIPHSHDARKRRCAAEFGTNPHHDSVLGRWASHHRERGGRTPRAPYPACSSLVTGASSRPGKAQRARTRLSS